VRRLEDLVPQKRAEIKEMLANHGDKQIGTCTVSQAVGGMRDVTSMLWETSLLDSEEVRAE
jgi:citrate synthase